VIEIVKRDRLVAKTKEMGDLLLRGLNELAKKYPSKVFLVLAGKMPKLKTIKKNA
jgi:4-aminobutyrate aminotransferase-like enzyme